MPMFVNNCNRHIRKYSHAYTSGFLFIKSGKQHDGFTEKSLHAEILTPTIYNKVYREDGNLLKIFRGVT